MSHSYTDEFGWPLKSAQAALWAQRTGKSMFVNGAPANQNRRVHIVTFNDDANTAGANLDEVDFSYLNAVRISPRRVGVNPGQIPYAVALRLRDAGFVSVSE